MTKINWYRRLWSVVGKRPWTFIYRDLWHRFEWFAQMQWLLTGALAYMIAGWKGVAVAVGIYTYGYINGHFFWGKKYIPGQIGDLKRADEVWKCGFCPLLGTYAEVEAHIKAKHYRRLKTFPIRRLPEVAE